MEESGRASHDVPLSDDESIAKMGDPGLWPLDAYWVLVIGWMSRAGGSTGVSGDDH